MQLENLKISQEQVRSELCRRSFYFFVMEMWSTIINEKPVWNWHIKYLCDHLQEIALRVKDRNPALYDWEIINVPPGSTKSTIITVLYPMWVWTMDATQRFICGSYSSTVSEDLAGKAKKVFTSDKYQLLFPDVGIFSDAKTKLENGKNAERYTTSTSSTITGIHAHQIIIDDPMSPQSASSEAERLTANKWMTETLGSRKVDKEVTVSILVMQRLHEDDCTGFLLSQKDIRVNHICLPAELPGIEQNNVSPVELREYYVDGLFDPVRLSRPVLVSQKGLLGSYGFAGQYDQRPVNLSGGILKRDWFEIVDKYHADRAKKFQLDTAYTSKSENDPSGIFSYFVEDNVMYVTDWQSHLLEFPELCVFVQSHVASHGYDGAKGSIVRVEPKASGKSLVQELFRKTKLNIVESDNPDKDKVTRATSIAPQCESGRVKLVRGLWNEAFLNEVCVFPKGKHDEAVDCLVEAVRNEIQYSSWTNIVG